MDDTPLIPEPAPRPCPRCGKPAVLRHRPFCSARCANLDLGSWLNGDYRIPVNDDDAERPSDEDEG